MCELEEVCPTTNKLRHIKQLSTIWVCRLWQPTLVKPLRLIIIRTTSSWSKNPKLIQEGGKEESQKPGYVGGQGGQEGREGGHEGVQDVREGQGLNGPRPSNKCIFLISHFI